jgi:hypothetical protein
MNKERRKIIKKIWMVPTLMILMANAEAGHGHHPCGWWGCHPGS